ncbi:MAG TPA: hypothetical protein VK886_04705 [Vicinamibacterales bacterium]|nr:hypothetical protein [Vicinamibacterales bacterium]
MRGITAVVCGTAFMVALASPLLADTKTVKGEVVDVQCQAKKAENTGADHENCALSCAKRGAKMGILTADGVYVIAGDYTANKNEKLLPYVAKMVSATGEIAEQEGQKTITVAKMEAQKQ